MKAPFPVIPQSYSSSNEISSDPFFIFFLAPISSRLTEQPSSVCARVLITGGSGGVGTFSIQVSQTCGGVPLKPLTLRFACVNVHLSLPLSLCQAAEGLGRPRHRHLLSERRGPRQRAGSRRGGRLHGGGRGRAARSHGQVRAVSNTACVIIKC